MEFLDSIAAARELAIARGITPRRLYLGDVKQRQMAREIAMLFPFATSGITGSTFMGMKIYGHINPGIAIGE